MSKRLWGPTSGERGDCTDGEQAVIPPMSPAVFPNTNNPCKETYRGPAPESEKETRAVTDFIRKHLKSIKAYITIHSYSQMLLFPYGYTSELPPNHEDLVRRAKYASCKGTTIDIQLFINTRAG